MIACVPIYIFDSAKKEAAEKLLRENEDLGFTKNKINENDLKAMYKLLDFVFDESAFVGFWLDPEKDDDTGTKDIVIYIGNFAFRTPYTDKTYNFLCNILKKRQ
jgi:hypothetical protein